MTQEEKAKAYDEALERARKQRDEYQEELDKTDKDSKLASILRAAISAIELAFPELSESEDERIRKWLIEYFEFASKCWIHRDITPEQIFTYLERQKEQKPAEKQNYSGLNDLERAIHRGFLSAGVENVPITIIKETAKECIAQMKPAEWSEEDEKQ